MIRQLREEIATLKHMLAQKDRDLSSVTLCGGEQLLSVELERRTRDVFDMFHEWSRNVADSGLDTLIGDTRILSRTTSRDDVNSPNAPIAQGVLLQPRGPHLVFLGDHLTTQTRIYPLSEQNTLIGSAPNCHVQLSALGLLDTHCRITRTDATAAPTPCFVLLPEEGSACFVNHKRVSENGTVLPQGAILLLSNALFRFNNPAEADFIRRQGRGLLTERINELPGESDASFLGAAFRSSWQINVTDSAARMPAAVTDTDSDTNSSSLLLRTTDTAVAANHTFNLLERSNSLPFASLSPPSALSTTTNTLLVTPR